VKEGRRLGVVNAEFRDETGTAPARGISKSGARNGGGPSREDDDRSSATRKPIPGDNGDCCAKRQPSNGKVPKIQRETHNEYLKQTSSWRADCACPPRVVEGNKAQEGSRERRAATKALKHASPAVPVRTNQKAGLKQHWLRFRSTPH